MNLNFITRPISAIPVYFSKGIEASGNYLGKGWNVVASVPAQMQSSNAVASGVIFGTAAAFYYLFNTILRKLNPLPQNTAGESARKTYGRLAVNAVGVGAGVGAGQWAVSRFVTQYPLAPFQILGFSAAATALYVLLNRAVLKRPAAEDKETKPVEKNTSVELKKQKEEAKKATKEETPKADPKKEIKADKSLDGLKDDIDLDGKDSSDDKGNTLSRTNSIEGNNKSDDETEATGRRRAGSTGTLKRMSRLFSIPSLADDFKKVQKDARDALKAVQEAEKTALKEQLEKDKEGKTKEETKALQNTYDEALKALKEKQTAATKELETKQKEARDIARAEIAEKKKEEKAMKRSPSSDNLAVVGATS